MSSPPDVRGSCSAISSARTLEPSYAGITFIARFEDWAPHLRALLEGSDDVFVPRPLYTMPPEHSWPTRPGVTLLGDAAHVMPPFTGRGANMAMLDAVELVGAFDAGAGPSSASALRDYEQRMMTRMAPAIRETLDAQDWVLSKDGPEALLQAIRARLRPISST